MHITVKRAGALTTIQDLGRYGYQGQGIPVGGVMDPLAMRMANILMGNAENTPVIECIGYGPQIVFSEPVWFAVCGGIFQVYLNDRPVEMNRAYQAESGDELSVNGACGYRSCVIAFSAVMDLQKVYGSYATDLKSAIGPVEGRKLQNGDVIAFDHVRSQLPNAADRFFPLMEKKPLITNLRVIPGPNEEAFTRKGMETFFRSVYTVSSQSDKMGYRLEGEHIETVRGNDILSAGMTLGAVQVTPQQPILMMQDHAATGGYAVIAVLISADISRAAQLMPGERIHFVPVSLHDAGTAWKEVTDELEKKKKELSRRGIMRLLAPGRREE